MSRRWVVTGAVLVTLSACAGGSGSGGAAESTQPSIGIVSPSVFPTPTGRPPSLAPVAYGPTTLTSGAETCDVELDTATCTVTNTDPRVAGTVVYTWNNEKWGDMFHGSLVQWGRGRLVNSGGAWDGRYSGIWTSGTGDIINFWYVGTGGYAGLSYYMTTEFPQNDLSLQTRGLIFPGTPPTP